MNWKFFFIMISSWLILSCESTYVENSDEIRVRLLFEHLDSCSVIGDVPPPSPNLPAIDLSKVTCFEILPAYDSIDFYEDMDGDDNESGCEFIREKGFYYVVKIPEKDNICYWRPEKCSSNSKVNFLEQYKFLVKNTLAYWNIVSDDIILDNRFRASFHWYCKLVPFPCVDSTLLASLAGEEIQLLCFHDYTHCYLIGEVGIPRYVEQENDGL